jgi:hypothetical protein
MRTLSLWACSVAVAATLAGAAGAGQTAVGSLSVERGRGAVGLELRGVILGRVASGTLRVQDTTPRDPYVPLVVGRRFVQERVGPRGTVVYKGQGLRFRMLGGGYRILVRGAGISLSAVGRGAVTLDGEPRFPGDDTGVYSLDGVDCSVEPEECLPLPSEPERFPIGFRPEDGSPKSSSTKGGSVR